jgi:prepilin-type N-terminal cleavage/methylation domain-containing protein
LRNAARPTGRATAGAGFTLIELVVVITLLSLMLVFAIPRFENVSLFQTEKKISRWIMLKVEGLKERALRDRQVYILHIGTDSGEMWVTGEGMDEEGLEKARESAKSLPPGYRISDVALPDQGKMAVGRVDIRFYPKGYSDKAMIHIENDDGRYLSFLIEPFLSRVKRYEDYVELEE